MSISVGALSKLEAFACHHGADFYGLPRNGSIEGAPTVTLVTHDDVPFHSLALSSSLSHSPAHFFMSFFIYYHY